MIQLLMVDLLKLPKEVVVEYIDDTKKEVNYYNSFDYVEAIDVYIEPQDILLNYVVLDKMMMVLFAGKGGKKEFKIYKEA